MGTSIGAVGLSLALGLMSMSTASPTNAADKWTMPDVRTEVLQNAVDDVQSAVGDVELNFSLVPRNVNQVVYNYSNWAVCATSPTPGEEVSYKSKRKIIFSLRRLNEQC